MKHIAIDGRFILRHQRGMPLYVYNICKRLPHALKDVQFSVLVNSKFEHNAPIKEYEERLNVLKKIDNVHLIDIESDDEQTWELSLLPKWLKHNKPNLLHMPTNRVILLTKTPQIATFHDCMEWKYLKKIHSIPSNASPKLKFYFLRKRFYVWLQYKLGLRLAAHVITISEFSKKSLLREFPFLNDKVSYTYHGIPENFSPLDCYETASSRQGVLMLGGESFQKNPINALKAYSILPECVKNAHPLTIAGFKPTNSSPIIEAIEQLELKGNVEILEWVDESKLINLFQKSKALLFVSREEGFGFPLVQAMACGTPVVISDAEVLSEIAGDAAHGAPSENPEKISDVLVKTLNNDNYWQDMHDKCLTRASAFGWDEMSQHIISCYKKFLK